MRTEHECLAEAAEMERLAARSHDHNARRRYRELGRSWRLMSNLARSQELFSLLHDLDIST